MSPSSDLPTLIQQLLLEHGLDLRGYKTSTLERRIRKRMAQLGVGDYDTYAEVLKADSAEQAVLLNTVLINVTEFFRDPQAWESLRTEALPPLLKRLRPGDTLRCWSAGCANGEEPYSLAIMIADLLGDRLSEIDVRIYGTDLDEESLALARRGEYTAEELRRVPPALRERYFTGSHPYRVHRDLRRMLILGRSNLLLDAPISHCSVIVCRNLLIYFDPEAQQQVIRKIHYALEPGGVLFLGSAESKLHDSTLFRPINARRRIFQKIRAAQDYALDGFEKEAWEGDPMQVNQEQFRMQQELNRLRLQQRYLLETLKSSVLVLDADNVITSGNDATHAIWGIPASRLIGRSLENSELGRLCPELGGKLARPAGEGQAGGTGATGHQTFELQCRVQVAGEERVLSLTVRPITGDDGAWHGSLVYSEDMTHRRRLQQTVAQLENTSSELQSANEELETTNEELQSTNEELETTNKELQSTNEELETTNEELQSVNEELENMNEELEARTRELNALSSRYAETWQRMPWPVLLVDRNEKIQVSNAAAQALLELQQSAAAGLRFDLLPIEAGSRRSLLVSLRRVIDSREPGVLRHYALPGDEAEEQVFDVHLTPILESGKEVEGVLIMFGPQQLGTAGRRKSSQPTEAKDQL